MTLKQERMNERIRAILSDLLLREVSDPRLQGLTVTEVSVDAELRYADVYVNALGDESRQDEVMEGLEHAGGYLRREVGHRIRTRNTPELNFHWDDSIERGTRMLKLIQTVVPGTDIDPEDASTDTLDR